MLFLQKRIICKCIGQNKVSNETNAGMFFRLKLCSGNSAESWQLNVLNPIETLKENWNNLEPAISSKSEAMVCQDENDDGQPVN
jgi:hypothetical protein